MGFAALNPSYGQVAARFQELHMLRRRIAEFSGAQWWS
jgi:hypothetical protein